MDQQAAADASVEALIRSRLDVRMAASDEETRLGEAFSLKGLHAALLYLGSLPISFHRRLLAGEGGGPTPLGLGGGA